MPLPCRDVRCCCSPPAPSAEEARWRGELREREAARLLVLEAEWRRRERSREAELGGARAEYLALEERAQKVGVFGAEV